MLTMPVKEEICHALINCMNSLNQTYLKLLQDDESDAFQEAGTTLRTIAESLTAIHNGIFENEEDESYE